MLRQIINHRVVRAGLMILAMLIMLKVGFMLLITYQAYTVSGSSNYQYVILKTGFATTQHKNAPEEALSKTELLKKLRDLKFRPYTCHQSAYEISLFRTLYLASIVEKIRFRSIKLPLYFGIINQQGVYVWNFSQLRYNKPSALVEKTIMAYTLDDNCQPLMAR